MWHFNYHLTKHAREKYCKLTPVLEQIRRQEYSCSAAMLRKTFHNLTKEEKENVRFNAQVALKECACSIRKVRENYIRFYAIYWNQTTLLLFPTAILIASVVKSGHYYMLLIQAILIAMFILSSKGHANYMTKQLKKLYTTHGYLEAMIESSDYRNLNHIDINRKIY